MSLSDLPVEALVNICSFLGGDAYVASMVPYLRPCVSNPDKREFLVQVYERQDFAFIYLYQILPTHDTVERCIHALVEEENQTLLSWLLARKPSLLNMVGKEAANLGSYKILTWCMYLGYKLYHEAILDAIKSGNATLILHLHFLGYSQPDVGPELALQGNLDLLQKLQVVASGPLCYCAAEGGHVHVLEWAEEQGSLEKSYVLNGALSGLQRKTILWLQERGVVKIPSYSYSFMLSSKGQEEDETLAFLQWLDQRTEMDYSLLAKKASYGGYVKILRWCVSKVRVDSLSLDGVFRKGSREDVELFAQPGYHSGHYINYYLRTLEGANLEVWRWIEEKGYPRLLNIAECLVRSTDSTEEKVIACLEYCLTRKEKEFALSDLLFYTATIHKKVRVFDWLLKNVPCSKERLDLCFETSINVPCIEIFSRLSEMGCNKSREDLLFMIERVKFNNPLLKEEMLGMAA